MSAYKPTVALRGERVVERSLTADNEYWKAYDTVAVLQEVADVKQVAFRPGQPATLAAVSSTRVSIINACSGEPVHKLSRFKCAVNCMSYRADGNLLAAGTEDGHVRIFDTSSNARSALRHFNAHNRAVQSCVFGGGVGNGGGRQVYSAGADGCIKCWNVTDTTDVPVLAIGNAHTDAIRSLAAAHTNAQLVASGSYDQTVCLWDSRCPQQAALRLSHGAPVEQLLMFPNDQLLVSVGGTSLKVWDLAKAADAAPLMCVSAHHKTITCAAFGSRNTRLLTGGLDRHVKVYDISTQKVVHTLDYPAPVLSLAVAESDAFIACGMTRGRLLSILKQKSPDTTTPAGGRPAKSFALTAKRRRLERSQREFDDVKLKQLPDEQAAVVRQTRPKQLAPWDRCMKTFKHHDALTRAITCPHLLQQRPEIICELLDQLGRRRLLPAALAGRGVDTLAPLVNLIARYISSESMSRVLTMTANTLLDVYFPADRPSATFLEPQLAAVFDKLASRLQQADQLAKQCAQLNGMVDMLISCAEFRNTVAENDDRSMTTLIE